jgi:hypothetical protein
LLVRAPVSFRPLVLVLVLLVALYSTALPMSHGVVVVGYTSLFYEEGLALALSPDSLPAGSLSATPNGTARLCSVAYECSRSLHP